MMNSCTNGACDERWTSDERWTHIVHGTNTYCKLPVRNQVYLSLIYRYQHVNVAYLWTIAHSRDKCLGMKISTQKRYQHCCPKSEYLVHIHIQTSNNHTASQIDLFNKDCFDMNIQPLMPRLITNSVAFSNNTYSIYILKLNLNNMDRGFDCGR